MAETKPRLVLIDANALVHRAFHAINPLTVHQTGELVNAVFGFTQMLLKAMADLKPAYIACAFDTATPTFRHQRFEDYKANRPKTADELVAQFPRVRDVVRAFNIPIFELEGYEADDILGSLSRQASEKGLETIIVTGDADAMQLVKPDVKVFVPGRSFSDVKLYDEEGVKLKFGVTPTQIPDFKGLVGDTSDNIPGVKGIGEITAVKLLGAFHNIEGIYQRIEEVAPPKVKEILKNGQATALESKALATIDMKTPVELDLEACRMEDYDRSKVVALFRELEFNHLLKRLPESGAEQPRLLQPVMPLASGTMKDENVPCHSEKRSFEESVPVQARILPLLPHGTQGQNDKETLFSRQAEASSRVEGKWQTITSADELAGVVQRLAQSPSLAIDTETSSTDSLTADLVGISLCCQPGEAFYIPLGHRGLEGVSQLSYEQAVSILKPLVISPQPARIAHNGKFDMNVLARYGLEFAGLDFDTMVAAYILSEKSLGLKDLAFRRLGLEMTDIIELIGKGAKQISMALVPIDRAAPYACADADVTMRLYTLLDKELREKDLWDLFNGVEMPLVPLLSRMERTGVALDLGLFREMSRGLGEQVRRLELDIYDSVGHQFNINSPQQLGRVLFEELHLATKHRTKSGYSTEVGVLEELRGTHDVIPLIIEYRQLTKLRSTYIDALPGMVNPATGRVHTSFNQTSVATGRLSSSDPNLQNIPVRGELGKQIRKAFTVQEGWWLLSADYSQIDLRALAHLSQDPRLVEAFRLDEDIHSATAREIYGVEAGQVTPDMRRLAKTVNFGVIYGMSEYGLEQATDLSREEAGKFIRAYFEKYQGVVTYLEATKKQAREIGYVQTLLGRRRYIPEVKSLNRQLREAAERMAINMPVQGTSADIIKVAMVRLQKVMDEKKLKTRMLLQVHDELLFEVPPEELEEMKALVKEIMPHAVELSVPVKVDIKVGRNWGEMS